MFSLFLSYSCFFCIVYPVFKTDPTATEHAEEVDARVRGRDREDEADAGAPLNQLLQTPPDLRLVFLSTLLFIIWHISVKFQLPLAIAAALAAMSLSLMII